MSSRVLGDLKDREFEHLSFDLLTLLGMRNLIWRTPGADGGRDIEGEVITRDFSGDFRREKWYVECKVRKTSLSWPDVFEKIAYAQNQSADILLICCSSTLSPRCKDEVEIHNQAKRRPHIHYWEGADITQRVEILPGLMEKYRFASPMSDGKKLSALMLHGLKAIQASYLSMDAAPQQVDLPRSFHLALAIAEFCNQLTSMPFQIILRPIYGQSDELGSAVKLAGFSSPFVFPMYALKVVIAAVSVVSRRDDLMIYGDSAVNQVNVSIPDDSNSSLTNSSVLDSIMREVAILSNLEIHVQDRLVQLRQRNS